MVKNLKITLKTDGPIRFGHFCASCQAKSSKGRSKSSRYSAQWRLLRSCCWYSCPVLSKRAGKIDGRFENSSSDDLYSSSFGNFPTRTTERHLPTGSYTFNTAFSNLADLFGIKLINCLVSSHSNAWFANGSNQRVEDFERILSWNGSKCSKNCAFKNQGRAPRRRRVRYWWVEGQSRRISASGAPTRASCQVRVFKMAKFIIFGSR